MALPPLPPTTLSTTFVNRYQATAEHVEDNDEPEFAWSYETGSSSHSSTPSPSRTSMILEDTDGLIWDGKAPAILCRRDLSNEVAMSLWGLVPPINFAVVMPGIYRSSFPKPENFSFLKSLGLKTILTLVPDEYPAPNAQFIKTHGIEHFQIGIAANKDPAITISKSSISAALAVVLNPQNYPLLIHCNKGKHRTGCVVGCLRKVMGWELAAIYTEYRRYAQHKARVLDERFIDDFDAISMLRVARGNNFITTDEPVSESPITSLNMSTRLRG